MNDGSRGHPAIESAVDALVVLAAAGAGGTGAAVAAAAAAAPMHVLATRAFQELGAKRLAAAERMVDSASARLCMTPSDLVDQSLNDPDAQAIFADALYAAARTFSEQKITALAAALANGLSNDKAKVDESHLVIRTLADLEEPHVRLLSRIAHSRVSYTVDDIADQLPGLSRAAAMAMVATFERHALLISDEDARQESVARTIRRAQGKVAAADLEARRRASSDGIRHIASDPLETPEWFVSRDEQAWVVTAFARTCWDYLADEAHGESASS